MARVNVREALGKHLQGYSREYDILLNQLSDTDIKDEDLLFYILGLQECVTCLGHQRETLVGVVLKMNWTKRSPKVVRDYQSFIVNLLSAHTFYVRAVLKMIVKKFKNCSEENDQERKMLLYLHSLLKAILHIVPSASSDLIPLLIESFPFHALSVDIQDCYLKNLLPVMDYLPTYRIDILELIVDRMTRIDVRIPRALIQDEEPGSDNEEAMFVMEGIPNSCPTKKPLVDVTKLDIMMECVFAYIKDVCYSNGELNWEATKKLYRELLIVFDKILLPTYASCHVQFIMFYICSLKEPLVDGFLDYLWKKVNNPNTQPVFRQTAVAYMASFVARALYIPISVVKAVLDLMIPWIHGYIRQTADSNFNTDVKCHGPFYSVCQAVFYILAFRHNELLLCPGGLKYCQSLNLQTIVTSRLNPLRVCLPTVATTFASVTRQHQLAFCDTVLERNRRLLLPEVSTRNHQMVMISHDNPLDCFFPFDPYLLTRSKIHIHPLYREYTGVAVDGNETDITDQEEFMEGSYSDHGLSISPKKSLKSPSTSLEPDFMMYGVSPGFKHL